MGLGLWKAATGSYWNIVGRRKVVEGKTTSARLLAIPRRVHGPLGLKLDADLAAAKVVTVALVDGSSRSIDVCEFREAAAFGMAGSLDSEQTEVEK